MDRSGLYLTAFLQRKKAEQSAQKVTLYRIDTGQRDSWCFMDVTMTCPGARDIDSNEVFVLLRGHHSGHLDVSVVLASDGCVLTEASNIFLEV